jgi:hypothetical protein
MRASGAALDAVAAALAATYNPVITAAGEVPEWSIGTVSKTVVRICVPWVRIPPSPPVRNRTANAGCIRLCTGRGCQHLKQAAFRADDSDLAVCGLHAPGERAEVAAASACASSRIALRLAIHTFSARVVESGDASLDGVTERLSRRSVSAARLFRPAMCSRRRSVRSWRRSRIDTRISSSRSC